ncbi:MAG: extracellular solute-binding protein [Bacillaceae bacterium]|nr:extracellular solute-binding protein [Bacillaceae bacterium]
MPSVVETYALYYNTDRITKAPETMDDLNRIIEDQFNPTNNEYGFLYDATNFYFSYAFMSGYGGYVFGEEDFIFDIDDLGLANEGSVKAGHLISNWFKDGYFPVGLDYDNKSGLFIEGKVGAVVNGPWALNDYRDALGDSLAVSYLPRLDNGEYPRSFIGVKGWMLSQYSENPYWATQLAIFLTMMSLQKSYFEATGEIPPNLAILTDETLLEDRLLSGFLTQLTRGEAFPNVAELSQVWDPMADALFFIAQGDDPKEALDEAVENIREQIELVNQ